jgi:hypothetical protein
MLTSIDKFFIVQNLQDLKEAQSVKRPEENYKFIFKRCIKHLKEEFRTDEMTKLKKREFDSQFYQFYFQKIADHEKIPLESFFHPKNSKSKAANCPRSINISYIQNLSKSKEFTDKFLDYLNKQLESRYSEIIDSKILSLTQKWELEWGQTTEREKLIEEICNYVEKNTKCKLPWTMNEVKEGVAAVHKLFEQSRKKKPRKVA